MRDERALEHGQLRLTPPTAGTFTVPGGITAKIYAVVGGNLGRDDRHVERPNPNIPYRPSAISDSVSERAPAEPTRR